MPLRMLCLTVFLLFASLQARAAEEGAGEAEESSGPDGMMVGYGFANNVSGVNLEWAFERNTVYVMPGVYFDSGGAVTDDPVWVAGYRHRLEEGTTYTDGFFTGLIAGHLDGTRNTDRLGFGGELGHQWVADYTRWTLSAGLAALEEPEPTQEQQDTSVEPEAFFSFSVSLR